MEYFDILQTKKSKDFIGTYYNIYFSFFMYGVGDMDCVITVDEEEVEKILEDLDTYIISKDEDLAGWVNDDPVKVFKVVQTGVTKTEEAWEIT